MYGVLRFLRGVLFIIGLWQILTAMPALQWIGLPIDAPGLASGVVTLIFKISIAIFSFGLYFSLRPLQAKLSSSRSAAEPHTTRDTTGLACFNWNGRKIFVASLIITSVTGISIIKYWNGWNEPPLAEQCTPYLEALQEHYPNLKDYSLLEAAEFSIRDVPIEQKEETKKNVITSLQSCHWFRIPKSLNPAIYIDRDSVKFLPNDRRISSVLFDYDVQQTPTIDQQQIKYQSTIMIDIVDCKNFGSTSIGYGLMSDWFGLGEKVSSGETAVDINELHTIPLSPTQKGTRARMKVTAICSVANEQ